MPARRSATRAAPKARIASIREERSSPSPRTARLRWMAQKRYLFTPGPTPVPPQVLAALAEPVLHHRAPDFREVYARVLGRLKEVHRTENEVLLFTCSGTGRSSRRSSASARRVSGYWPSRPVPSATAG